MGEANRPSLAASAHVKIFSRALDAKFLRRSRCRLLGTPGIATAAVMAMFSEGGQLHSVYHVRSAAVAVDWAEGDLNMTCR